MMLSIVFPTMNGFSINFKFKSFRLGPEVVWLVFPLSLAPSVPSVVCVLADHFPITVQYPRSLKDFNLE
ncbi:hypothetical protein SAMN05444412_1071 [Rhodonellum ikkaensis]|uniref:Uncharacterized protein n=1 Tax=Rhodonellum ikkaensis TaxID=336829 RepID=A0A1H3QTY7_9BACT|nr:hypothetical protein SAMN05444412_1071 [Rhodonellum ikkaensis]